MKKNNIKFLLSRPNKLDEISFQEEVVSILNGILQTGEVYLKKII